MRPGKDIATGVECERVGDPVGAGAGADEDEYFAGLQSAVFTGLVVRYHDCFEEGSPSSSGTSLCSRTR